MYGYVVIALIVAVVCNESAAPPLRVTIDCGSNEKEFYRKSSYRNRPLNRNSPFDVGSFCDLIHAAIPKGVADGTFLLGDADQSGSANTLLHKSAPPPEGFIPKIVLPKFRNPKLKYEKVNVPQLRPQNGLFSAPRVASPITFLPLRNSEDETSTEKMEKFKKGVQKMLHVVKVLGQIDQYLSERTRILIDKLVKTFSD